MSDSCCCFVCVRTQEVGVVEGKRKTENKNIKIIKNFRHVELKEM
jgi:hypothetical protein